MKPMFGKKDASYGNGTQLLWVRCHYNPMHLLRLSYKVTQGRTGVRPWYVPQVRYHHCSQVQKCRYIGEIT